MAPANTGNLCLANSLMMFTDEYAWASVIPASDMSLSISSFIGFVSCHFKLAHLGFVEFVCGVFQCQVEFFLIG